RHRECGTDGQTVADLPVCSIADFDSRAVDAAVGSSDDRLHGGESLIAVERADDVFQPVGLEDDIIVYERDVRGLRSLCSLIRTTREPFVLLVANHLDACDALRDGYTRAVVDDHELRGLHALRPD